MAPDPTGDLGLCLALPLDVLLQGDHERRTQLHGLGLTWVVLQRIPDVPEG